MLETHLPDVEVVGPAPLERVPFAVIGRLDESARGSVAGREGGLGRLLRQSSEKALIREHQGRRHPPWGAAPRLWRAVGLACRCSATTSIPSHGLLWKTELAQVKKAEVEALLADIEADVKPQIMPFYACGGPHGERGNWTRIDRNGDGRNFRSSCAEAVQRKDFKYEGPEIFTVFWSKHGPCQILGCGHRTPIMSTPVVGGAEGVDRQSVVACCNACHKSFDIEDSEARMAPDVPCVLGVRRDPVCCFAEERKRSMPLLLRS